MFQLKKLHFLLVFLAISFLICYVPGASGQESPGKGKAKPPGKTALKILTVALNSKPISVDPANHRHRNTQTLVRNWTDGLLQRLSDGRDFMDVAKSITAIDPKTYEFKVRQGITFHNGDPLTADDVVFSFKRLALKGGMEGKTSPRATLIGPVETVEKIDDYTVIVKLREAPNSFEQSRRWYNVEMMPKKYFEAVGIEGFLKKPIGCGPFKWVEGDLSTQVVLERYENYNGGAPEIPGNVARIPALDRVIFKFIPESTTRVAALLAGEVDIIQNVPLDTIPMLKSNPNIRVVGAEGTNFIYMAFNTTRPPFNDKRVRQAIAYAINYDAICKQLLLGYSTPLYGRPIMESLPGTPGYGQFRNLKGFNYSPEKAKALLKEAGATGTVTVIDTYGDYVEQAQVVAQMLDAVGLKTSVRVWDFAVLRDAVMKRERQIFFGIFGANRYPTNIEHLVKTGAPNNYSMYSNSKLDDLLNRAEKMEDSPKRNALITEALKLVLDEMPVLQIHNPYEVEAIRSHVKNFFPSVVGRVNLHRVDLE